MAGCSICPGCNAEGQQGRKPAGVASPAARLAGAPPNGWQGGGSPQRRRPRPPAPPLTSRCRRPSRRCRCQRPARRAQRPRGGPAASARRWWAAPGARRSGAGGRGQRGRTAPAGGAAGEAGARMYVCVSVCVCVKARRGRTREGGGEQVVRSGRVPASQWGCGRCAAAARTCLWPLRAWRRSQSRTSLASSAKPSMRACCTRSSGKQLQVRRGVRLGEVGPPQQVRPPSSGHAAVWLARARYAPSRSSD